MRKLLSAFLALLCLIGITKGLPARAQTTARLTLFALDTSAYPTLSAALDVFDASGNFVTGLTPGQVSLLEDNLDITPASLQELQPGVQFAVALDSGPAFAFRDTDAVTRLDKVNEVLRNWAAAHSDAFSDELSLLPNGGTASLHLTSAAAFSDALSAYLPDLQTLRPSLDTLSGALDTVSGAGSQVGMKRVVLYIASPPEADSIPALQNLTQRAVDLEVRVHVWIVASTDFFATSGATALKDLSILTGGTYALFSGTEPLPDPETYLTPLRHAYTLTYPSSIRSAGTHTLSAQVNINDGTITSNSLSFELNVQLPNPILVAPPGQIVRQGADPRASDFAAFQPSTQEIEAIIEFPDGMPRPLVRTALYVDGILADENISEPFDHFTWDLSSYAQSGDHILQVQAADNLGLEKTSLGLTVTVTVVQPERGALAFLSRNSLWVVLGAVGVAGAAVAVTLLVGRKGAKRIPKRKTSPRSRKDPLTAEVESAPEARTRRTHWGRAAAIKQSDAYLLRLKEDGQPVTATPIPVTTPEMTFGSDPIQATRVLDDPSVSPLHARLREENGQFVLTDEKSASGTWVNHEPLVAPLPLRHGDVLHIGRISYRFMLRRPPETPAPRILPVKK
ncbi:MAG: FHA domain-containing protein [Chloroflexi bacterium]|nr:FHA domain-containing protein [Chloroflexota bacterium]